MDLRPDGPDIEFPSITEALRKYQDKVADGNDPYRDVQSLFAVQLSRFSSKPESFWQRSGEHLQWHITIVNSLKTGGLSSQVLDFPSTLESLEFHRYVKGFVATAKDTLKDVDNIRSRTLILKTGDDYFAEAYFMDMLIDVYGINLPTLWHTFRIQHDWTETADIVQSNEPLLEEYVTGPLNPFRTVSLGQLHAIFIEEGVQRTENVIPTSIVFRKIRRHMVDENKYIGDPFAASAYHFHVQPLALHLSRAILSSKFYSNSHIAKSLYAKTGDEVETLLAGHLELADHNGCCEPFKPSLTALLQYHIEASRLVLAEHLIPINGYRHSQFYDREAHKKNEPYIQEAAGSWQRLELMLQHLKQQRVQFLRFTSTMLAHLDLLKESEDFDRLIEEFVGIVSHKRGRLDHELSQSLLRESKANLRVASLSINESRGARVLTILAFIFVPFSLATSIFGMNIQELNQSGTSLANFITTAFTLFAGAVVIWFLTTTIAQAQANNKQRRTFTRNMYPGTDRAWKRMWYDLYKHPQRIKLLFGKGVLLGILSKGCFDLEGFIYARDALSEGEASTLTSWAKGGFSYELKSFLGLERLPEEENYETVFKARSVNRWK